MGWVLCAEAIVIVGQSSAVVVKAASREAMQNRISHSIARVGIGIALVAGFVLSSIQIYLDYQAQKLRNDLQVGHALHIASAGATQAAYQLSSAEVDEALKSLMIDEHFMQVQVVSDTGEMLGNIKRAPQSYFSEPLISALLGYSKAFGLDLYHQQSKMSVGTLRVSVHTATIMKDFVNRSIRQLVIGLLRSLILTAILLYAFNFMLTRPITEFVDKLKKVDPRAPKAIAIPHRIATAQDELTDLAESTNENLSASAAYLVEIDNKRREKREISDQLRHSEQLSTVGRLTGGVAHDFNNILAVLLSSLEMLKYDKQLSSDGEKIVDTGVQAIMQGTNLTSQLLSFSRRQPLDPAQINVQTLFETVQSILSQALGVKYDLTFNIDEHVWPLFVDARQLETVILNLAINARDAMPDGGSIAIGAESVHLQQNSQCVQRGELAVGDYVLIQVADHGEGMTPDVVANAFEPYFTTKEVGKGSGLGLAMAHGFIKQSGGHIQIAERLSAGTTIEIFLPRSDPPSPYYSVETLPQDTNRAVLVGKTLLIVEDNLSLQGLIKSYLSRLEIHSIAVADGAAAMAAAQKAEHLDAALVDVILPGTVNGSELAEQLKGVHPGLCCVFMSGYLGEHSVQPQEPASDAVLLKKPFQLYEVSQVLEQVFRDAD